MSCDNLMKKLKDYNETLKKWHNRIDAEDMMLKAVVGNFNKDLTKILNDNEPTPAKDTSDKATDLIPVVNPRFDNKLRDKFFKECTTETPISRDLKKINCTPHNLFEWFKTNVG